MKTQRPVIYQLFPRLFANVNQTLIPNGRIENNGCGKLADINSKVLKAIGDMGFTHIWFTGVIEHAHDVDYTRYGIKRHNPKIIKGRAGSPYAITDYYDIDPDLAKNVDVRMAEFEALIARTKESGMEVIIDFVPNHVARQYHSDSAPKGVKDLGDGDDKEYFFKRDNNFYYIPRQQFSPQGIDLGSGSEEYVEFPARATGNDCFTAFPGKYDWYETVKLNYGYDPGDGSTHFEPVPDTWYKMLHILRYWASKGVSGFRCDMAHMVPAEFWKWAIEAVKKDYPGTLFIAELYDVGIYKKYLDAGFDYLYDKVNLYDTLRGIEAGETSAAQLTSCWQAIDGMSDRMLNFLENHDEQRFASDFYAKKAENVIPSLVALTTLSRGAIMIYNGQELGEKGMDCEGYSGCDGRTTIFDYWSMETVRRWLGQEFVPSEKNLTDSEQRLRHLYAKLLTTANREKVFRQGDFFDLMYVNYESAGFNPHRHYSYLRSSERECVLIFLNFENKEAKSSVKIPNHAFNLLELPFGEVKARDILTGAEEILNLHPDSSVKISVPPKSAKMLKFSKK